MCISILFVSYHLYTSGLAIAVLLLWPHFSTGKPFINADAAAAVAISFIFFLTLLSFYLIW
jgi:hypothetical protein